MRILSWCEENAVAVVVGLTVLIVVGVAVAVWTVGPCHSQHKELVYHEAYKTQHCVAWMKVGNVNTCTSYTYSNHPARCEWRTVCDARCNDFPEKHEKHEPYMNETLVDERCKP